MDKVWIVIDIYGHQIYSIHKTEASAEQTMNIQNNRFNNTIFQVEEYTLL